MDLDAFLAHFSTVRPLHPNQWTAQCPAHDDRSADTLSIALGVEGRRLLYCWAGCATSTVLDAAGLTVADLFIGEARGLSLVPVTYREHVAAALRALIAERERRYGPYLPLWAMSQRLRWLRQEVDIERRMGALWGDTEEGWEFFDRAANLERTAHGLETEADSLLADLRRSHD